MHTATHIQTSDTLPRPALSSSRAHPSPASSARPERVLGKRGWLKLTAYPALLVAVLAVSGWAVSTGQNLPLVATLTIIGAIGLLVALERLIPFEQSWQPSLREWLRDLLYFGIDGAADGIAQVLVLALAVVVAPAFDWLAADLPLLLAIPLALLIGDLGGYWMHRKSHDFQWLWKVHGVHHAPTKVNTINNNTAHFLNVVFSNAARTLPLLLLGFGAEAIFVAGTFITVQSFAVHANADVRLGALNWFIMGPEHHRLHHSTVIAEAGNHATALTLWDRLFGTFTWRPGRTPTGIGTTDPNEFPDPNRIIANAMVPFRCEGS